ncbi:MAG: Carboxymethylenebutenolidase [Acidobacteria bacterium]|nr:Carboxymethylenebutenolidase [Acidobacteriota bacterium]
MRRVSIVFALTLIAAVSVHAQEHQHAGSRATSGSLHKATPKFEVSVARGKMVPLPGGGNGYLSLPSDKSDKHPAIIVIQEWWGLNDWIMQQTDRFAKQGYVTLAVDLYRGKATSDPEVAHELMRGMPEDRAMADLKSGFALLAARADVDASHIGVIGWCMGGGYSLGLATVEPRVAATVMNYGRLVTDPATIAKIESPILGNFGALDRGIPPADVEAFDVALKKAGKSADIKIYPGAGHGFMNPNNKDGYVKGAADDAWARIDSFFAKRLKP